MRIEKIILFHSCLLVGFLIFFGNYTIAFGQCNLSVSFGPCQTTYIGYGSNCVNLAANVSGGTAPFTYLWNPYQGEGQTVQDCPVADKSYTVTVTDANGCTAKATTNVIVYDVRCGNGLDKTLVCHGGKLSCVSQNTIQNHLSHGDVLGSCNTNPCNSLARIGAEMEDVTDIQDIRIYAAPNPAVDEMEILIINAEKGFADLNILDLSGKKILGKKILLSEGENKLNLNLKTFNTGIYYLQIKDITGGKANFKLFKR